MNVIVVRLGFTLFPGIKRVDLPDIGRVFVNHLPEVEKETGEFVLVRSEGQYGIAVTPCAPVSSGFKRADTAEKLVELALSAGICEAFKPRNFHGRVAEGLERMLKNPWYDCPFGAFVTLEDGSSVLVASKEAIPANSLVEAVRAVRSTLVIKSAEFTSTEPFIYEALADFVDDLLDEDRPKVPGRLVPRPAKKTLTGLWLGESLSYVNARGQASCRVPLDGPTEGTYSVAYFTRCNDATPEVPIPTGSAVTVKHDRGANFTVTPFEGRLEKPEFIEPEKIPGLLGVNLPAEEPKPTNGARLKTA